MAVLRDVRNTTCVNLMIIQEGRALPQIAIGTGNLSALARNLMRRSDKKQPRTGQTVFCRKDEEGQEGAANELQNGELATVRRARQA